VSLADRVEVDLHLFELDTGIGEFAVELAIAVDLAGESPVVMVNCYTAAGVIFSCDINALLIL